MKDFLGNELAVGDDVVMMLPGYRSFRKGTIHRFTKCYAVVRYKSMSGTKLYDSEIKQEPSQLVKFVN